MSRPWTICPACRQPVTLIQTRYGDEIPCGAFPVRYREKRGGDVKIVTPDGDVVCCEPFAERGQATGWGYLPHRLTCKGK